MLANSAFKLILLAVLTFVLPSALNHVLALPAPPPLPNLISLQQNASSSLVPPNARPPQDPVCPSTEQWGATLGHPSYDDCDYILLNLYPKDPLAKPVMRNYYVASKDVSHSIPNFKLPYEQSHGTCSIQLLLATDFNNVPKDEATWNDLRGAAKTIFRACIRGTGVGGVVARNGKHGNIEIVVYGKDSIYAKNQILKYSTDQLARSIAAQELLELVKVIEVPDIPQSELKYGSAANQTVTAGAES